MATDKLTTTQVLLPVLLLSASLVGFFAFQTSLLVSERGTQNEVRTQQEKPLEQLGKLKAQLNTLATGTLKLSQEGDKDATNIIAQLKKVGVDVEAEQNPKPALGTAPAGITPTTGKAVTP